MLQTPSDWHTESYSWPAPVPTGLSSLSGRLGVTGEAFHLTWAMRSRSTRLLDQATLPSTFIGCCGRVADRLHGFGWWVVVELSSISTCPCHWPIGDRVHLAGDPCIVDDENSSGPLGYGPLNLLGINDQGVDPFIDEQWPVDVVGAQSSRCHHLQTRRRAAFLAAVESWRAVN